MKIKVQYQPKVERVFVWGLWGPKTIGHILDRLNTDIQNVNIELRKLQRSV